MTKEEIRQILVAELYCLRVTTEPDLNLFCDGKCDACKWSYQRGTNGQRKEMLKALIELMNEEIVKEWQKMLNDTPKMVHRSTKEQ